MEANGESGDADITELLITFDAYVATTEEPVVVKTRRLMLAGVDVE